MIKVLYVGGNKRSIPQLSGTDTNVDYVQNGMIALSAVQTQDFDAIIVEDQLPLMSASRLIEEFTSMDLNVPIISALRSDERRSQILDNFGKSVFSWFEPDLITQEDLLTIIQSAKRFHDFIDKIPKHLHRDFTSVGYCNMVGTSETMLNLYQLLTQIKNKIVTTVLYGESGTGKNLVANTLHKTSLRRDRPCISVNCPAIPSELLESELFGHEKGAFTGAIERKDGKFLAANAGTIFLDEIGDMSPSLQAKILRVLESGEIERVGGAETLKVDVRIISATNQNLEEKIKKSEFRQDLFHRINVFPITIPPLRDRKDDIPTLTINILKKLIKKHNAPVRYVSPAGMNLLKSHPWPGNIRELENSLERIVLVNDIAILTEQEIKPILHESSHISITEPINETVHKTEQSSQESKSDGHAAINPRPTSNNDTPHEIRSLKELEREAILEGLTRTNWNMTLTAQQLGISRMTLYRKLDQHGLRTKG